MSMPIRFTKRADFIAALEARRPWAVASDKQTTARHKADEKAALESFRTRCRDMAKVSYADLKATTNRRGYVSVEFTAPTCPDSRVTKLDKALASLAVTKQEVFTVDTPGPWQTAHFLLTQIGRAHV